MALGGTNLPVLMGETYQWQFELQDRGVAAAYAMVILGDLDRLHAAVPPPLRVPKEARI